LNGKQYFRVLFLCTGNSARSIMAEALLNHQAQLLKRRSGHLVAFSAGSQPAGVVHPDALDTLLALGVPTGGLYSKSWHEFAKPGGLDFDFAFTVCDNAAAEDCPVLPGSPLTAHWGVEDPAAFEGPDTLRKAEFMRVARLLKRRIEIFANLPLSSLQEFPLQSRLRAIGEIW